ncbi:MAG: hypothetical protein WA066_06295 [Candidatus Omnitrophota bacterium]
MTMRWESENDRLKKHIHIPAAKKLEWLEEMRRFTSSLSKKTLAIRRKVRGGSCVIARRAATKQSKP